MRSLQEERYKGSSNYSSFSHIPDLFFSDWLTLIRNLKKEEGIRYQNLSYGSSSNYPFSYETPIESDELLKSKSPDYKNFLLLEEKEQSLIILKRNIKESRKSLEKEFFNLLNREATLIELEIEQSLKREGQEIERIYQEIAKDFSDFKPQYPSLPKWRFKYFSSFKNSLLHSKEKINGLFRSQKNKFREKLLNIQNVCAKEFRKNIKGLREKYVEKNLTETFPSSFSNAQGEGEYILNLMRQKSLRIDNLSKKVKELNKSTQQCLTAVQNWNPWEIEGNFEEIQTQCAWFTQEVTDPSYIRVKSLINNLEAPEEDFPDFPSSTKQLNNDNKRLGRAYQNRNASKHKVKTCLKGLEQMEGKWFISSSKIQEYCPDWWEEKEEG